MAWLVYRFIVQPPNPGSEILMACLGEMPFESFDEQENGFNAYINEDQNSSVNLTGLQFEEFTYTFSIEKIERRNWNEEWEKNFEPVIIESLLYIRAPFHPPSAGTRHSITIMPKMSFGTGHHNTTRLMCRLMAGLEIKNKSVLDMGCGTGILAIFADRLGAASVLGIDIDEWSVENARENCGVNAAKTITIELGGAEKLSGRKPFDVIVANINKNILKTQLQVYASVSRPGTRLLMSGFFMTDVPELISSAAACGFSTHEEISEQEWAALGLIKTG